MSIYSEQEALETTFSRKNIRQHVEADILDTPILVKKLEQAAKLIEELATTEYSYDSKNRRMELLTLKDYNKIAMDVFCIVMKYGHNQLFTALVGQLELSLNYDSKIDGLKTAAEIISVVADTDVYDIIAARNNDTGMMQIKPNFLLDEEVEKFIRNTMYLPPMLCEPDILINNKSCGYRTIEKDSLILGGAHNHHDKDICLDNLNKFNQIPLALDLKVLSKMSEPDLTREKFEKSQNKKGLVFDEVKYQQAKSTADEQREVSYEIYKHIAKKGNKFWLTHKADKRGRTYSQGYHVHTQSSDFKKAIISLHEKEVIEL